MEAEERSRLNSSEDIERMLAAKTIAVVGLSGDPSKPSHFVSAYMQQAGKKILPVNPSIDSALGEESYAALSDLPVKPDVVNVFRLPKAIPAIVDEMIALGLKNLWVQQGICNEEAAAKAEAAGIRVVMDRCMMVEHRMRAR
jgi:predicted CoA-binding protein